MASSNPSTDTTHGGISSQAGLASLRTAIQPDPRALRPTALLTLIDAYANARADRDESYREHTGRAFDTAHAAMLTARAAVARALGIPEGSIPAPADPISRSHARTLAGGAL